VLLLESGHRPESIHSVVKGKVEDIDLPEKVDVIVSEWMASLLSFHRLEQRLILEWVPRAISFCKYWCSCLRHKGTKQNTDMNACSTPS
jgi:hypothetical protein